MTRMSNASGQPWTVGRLLNWTREHFQARGLDHPRLSAELLLAHAMNCRKIELYTRFEQVPPPEQVARFRELVLKAADQAPISYLIGHKEFFSLDFEVTPDVLIPRPETEALVEQALAFCKTLADERIEVLDVGTGSGCIAVAIARYEPRAHVLAADISPAAIEVARRNITKHGLTERIRTTVGDALDLPAHITPADGFHLIVSNPPYIAEADLAGLPKNVRDYEPRLALVSGEGLAMYQRLAQQAHGKLRSGGRIYVEIGQGQARQVISIFTQSGRYRHVGTWPDMAGIERVIGFERT